MSFQKQHGVIRAFEPSSLWPPGTQQDKRGIFFKWAQRGNAPTVRYDWKTGLDDIDEANLAPAFGG
jgi:hypothetical protein